jgi:hypothetical protein
MLAAYDAFYKLGKIMFVFNLIFNQVRALSSTILPITVVVYILLGRRLRHPKRKKYQYTVGVSAARTT